MARLPVPGSDEGQWGDILNDYLSASHGADGALKGVAVVNAIPNGSIGAAKLQQTYIQVGEKAQPDGLATLGPDGVVPVSQLPASTAPPDASTTTKGLVQLAGDLAGTAVVPTVPGLATKAAAATTITAGAGLIGGGDLSANRTLSVSFGTTAGTVAAGDDARIIGAEQTANKGVANGYAALDGGGKVPLAQLPDAQAVEDATTSTKGIVQLAGDLAGTAAAPTVPGLATKAAAATAITAGTGLIGGGDLSANRTLAANFGTTAGTIAQGDDIRIAGAEQTANKGVANGYASLDSGGKIPDAQLALGLTHAHIFSNTGTLVVETGIHRLYNDSARAWTIAGIRASVGIAPTGASVIVDININGTTIFTTQANRPTIAAGTFTSGKLTNMDIGSVAVGDYLTIDVDQIGSAVAGAQLTVQVEVR